MSPGDTIARAPTGLDRTPVSTTAETPPVPDLYAPVEATVAADFARVYGPAGVQARTAVGEAVQREGSAAYARLRTNPDAFGSVVGDRAEAAVMASRLEALDYSRSVGHASEGQRVQADGPGDVRAALATVRASLTLSGANMAVGQDNLYAITDALRTLSPGDATAVVADLSDTELRTWSAELRESDTLPNAMAGLDARDRHIAYGWLTQRLDAVQLVRFTSAMEAAGGGGREFGAAMADYAPLTVRAAYVQEAIRRGSDMPRGVAAATLGTLASLERNGTWNTAVVGDALRGADVAVFGALLHAGVARRDAVQMAGQVPAYSVKPARRLLDAVAATGDVRLSAAAFVGAQNVLSADAPGFLTGSTDPLSPESRAWRSASDEIRSGMTALLDGPTNAVVQEIRGQQDPEGQALVAYVEGLLGTGDGATISRHIARLQRGDQLDESPVVRFGANVAGDSGETTNENAARLGHYVGAVVAAFDNRGAARRDNAAAVGEIIGLIAPGPASDAAAAALGRLGAQGVDRDDALVEALKESAFPRMPDGRRYDGDGTHDYYSAIQTVRAANDHASDQ